jgi:aconitate hydratase
VTKAFLDAQGRGDCWEEITADADATYAKTIAIDLAEVEPMAAAPHSPGNIETINSMMGKKVTQVLIGSCTNSSYRDLKMVAKILEGKRVHPDVELGIAPGSRQVMLMLAKEKLLEVFLSAGARILENACGFCIGNSMSPPSEAISLRTSNRNFEGRSGTKSAQVYLVSPEVAALAAISGRVVDPLTLSEEKCPTVRQPKDFVVDDSMFLQPPKKGADIEIKRGPSIGEVPANEKLGEKLDGVVTIKVGDKITTDHIMPAGPRLKHRSNVPEYSKYVFEHVDPDFYERASQNRDSGIHNVIIAGESYGQGSSREHAALCPMYLGVKAVVAKSVERIHLANLINFGIVPFSFAKSSDYDKIDAGDRVVVEGLKACIKGDGKAVLMNQTKNIEIPLVVKLSDRQKKIITAGGLLPFTVKK